MTTYISLSSVVFDLDGVIYRGNTPRKGVDEILHFLENYGIKFHFLTNTSSKTRDEIVQKIINLGVEIYRDENLVTTSSEVAAHYLLDHFGWNCAAVTIGGASGISTELIKVGIKQLALEAYTVDQIVDECKGCADILLLIGWTKDYDYEMATKILRISKLVSHIYATDDDKHYSSDNGNLPGTAWINGSVSSLLEKSIVSFGKPNPLSLRYVFQKIGANPETSLMVGDNLFSDIQVGKAVGCKTAFILGGVSTLSEMELLDTSRKPDYIVNELTDIIDVIYKMQ